MKNRKKIGSVILVCLIVTGIGYGTWLAFDKAFRRDESREFWGVAVPGLTTGVGTLALALATVVLATQERSRNDRLRRQDQQRDDDLRREARKQIEEDRLEAERRRHAERVSAWAGQYVVTARVPMVGGTTGYRVTENERTIYGATVRNRSDLPIWSVIVFWHVDGGAPHNDRRTIDVVPPGEDRHQSAFSVEDLDVERLGLVSIQFRDAAGVVWTRDPLGRLAEGEVADPVFMTQEEYDEGQYEADRLTPSSEQHKHEDQRPKDQQTARDHDVGEDH